MRSSPRCHLTAHAAGRLGGGVRGRVGAPRSFAADAPPPARETFATPWPMRAPCAHPTALSLDEWLRTELVWSSADGATSLTFAPQKPKKPARLARTFPGDRLVRVSVMVGALPEPARRAAGCCASTAPTNRPSTWGPCVGRSVRRHAPSIASRRSRRPGARSTGPRRRGLLRPTTSGTTSTTRASSSGSAGGRRATPRSNGNRSGLRATSPRTCASAWPSPARGDAARSRSRSPSAGCGPISPPAIARYTLFEHSKAYDRWNTGWVWDATPVATTFKVDCGDMAESTQVFCSLELDVGDGLRVGYFPRNRAGSSMGYDVAVVDHPELGQRSIRPARSRSTTPAPGGGASLVEIRGRALALEPAADVGPR